MNKQSNNEGFALIALILTVVIIAIIFAIYYGGSKNGGQSMQQTQQAAIDQAKDSNASEIQNHLEIENQLNGIDR
ncbi:MAG TPA: hypothetical protein VE973_00400 [Candidatus Limnocylindria bacterium]|nr:hypothetical protein [Candidatus Limnocylindria bacterium]